MTLLLSFLLTLQFALNHEINEEEAAVSWPFLMISITALIFLVVIEVRQMKSSYQSKNLSAYFTSFQNWVDIAGLTLTSAVQGMLIEKLITQGDQDRRASDEHRLMAAASSFFMIFKIFDYCRIFPTYAFYVKLIIQTISDVIPFLVLFLVALIMFTTPRYIINLSWESPMRVFEKLQQQYAEAYGEYDEPGFDEPYFLYYNVLFLLSTILVTLIMLNMLIAIMSDTF